MNVSKTRGGKTPKLKGDRFEVEVANYFRAQGADCERIRQGQGEIIDLIVVSPSSQINQSIVYYVQCRLRGNMTIAERDLLRRTAQRVGAIPILACKNSKNEIDILALSL